MFSACIFAVYFVVSENQRGIQNLPPKTNTVDKAKNEYTQAQIARASNKLFEAVSNGQVSEVDRILGEGTVTPAVTTGTGMTPLMQAAELGFEPTVKLLLGRGAKINRVDSQGRSALFYAVGNSQVEMVKALLGEGASFKIVNFDKKTPLQSAQSLKDKPIIAILQKAGDYYRAPANLEPVKPVQPPVAPQPIPGQVQQPVAPQPIPGQVQQPVAPQPIPGQVQQPVAPQPIPGQVQQPVAPQPIPGQVQQPVAPQPVPVQVAQPPVQKKKVIPVKKTQKAKKVVKKNKFVPKRYKPKRKKINRAPAVRKLKGGGVSKKSKVRAAPGSGSIKRSAKSLKKKRKSTKKTKKRSKKKKSKKKAKKKSKKSQKKSKKKAKRRPATKTLDQKKSGKKAITLEEELAR